MKSLIVVGQDNIDGLGVVPKTIPFDEANEMQKKYNTRILVNKKGEIIKTITTQDLIELDREYYRKYGR